MERRKPTTKKANARKSSDKSKLPLVDDKADSTFLIVMTIITVGLLALCLLFFK